MNKKLILSSAVAAALGATSVANAVDLRNSNPADSPQVFANELAPIASGSLEGFIGLSIDDVETSLGAGVSDTQTRFLRLDITNGIFSADPSLQVFGVPVDDDADPTTPATDDDATPGLDDTLDDDDDPTTPAANDDGDAATQDPAQSLVDVTVAQGGAFSPFVIFQITAKQDIAQSARALVSGIGVFAADEVPGNIEYEHFETLTQATNQTDSVFDDAGPVIAFANAINIEVINPPTGLERIDVAQEQKFFDGSGLEDDETVIGDVLIELDGDAGGSGSAALDAAGNPLSDIDDVVGTNTAVLLTGNLPNDAFTDVRFLSNNCSGGSLFDTTDSSRFDANGNFVVPLGASEHKPTDICIEVTGDDVIPVTTFEVTYAPEALDGPTGASGANIPNGTEPATVGPVEISDLVKNGSEDTIPFATDAANQFFRITNPTDLGGAVFLSVFNDDGQSCQLDLDELNDRNGDPLPAELDPDQSTGLFLGSDLATACGFSGAIRLVVDGEFGDTEDTTGQGSSDGVRIDAFNASGFVPNR